MARKMYRTGVLAGCGLMATSLAAEQVRGNVTLFNSGGFESSAGYAAGSNLVSQPNGSGSVNSFVGSFNASSPTSTASVQTYANLGNASPSAMGGQQAVYVNSPALSSTSISEFYPQTYVNGVGTPYFPAVFGTPVVNVNFDQSVSSGNTGDPVFGILVFNQNGAETADLTVDGATGKVFYNNGTGTTTYTTTLGSKNFTSFEIQLNYATSTYGVYAGAQGGTLTSLVSGIGFENVATSFGYAAITSYSDAAAGTTSNGFAVLDNLSATAISPVPEPASASIIVGGALLMAGRRRRSLPRR